MPLRFELVTPERLVRADEVHMVVVPGSDGPRLTEVPSLDLYREPDPFRIPRPREFRSPLDVLEFLLMCTAAFPEPLTFSLRVAEVLEGRRADFDVVHDNQTLGTGLLALQRQGFPVVATVHHPITEDRRHDLKAARRLKKISTLRWYSFLRMQGRVVRRLPAVLTVSANSPRSVTSRNSSSIARRSRT